MLPCCLLATIVFGGSYLVVKKLEALFSLVMRALGKVSTRPPATAWKRPRMTVDEQID